MIYTPNKLNPLHFALSFGNIEASQLLFDQFWEQKSDNNFTSLHAALLGDLHKIVDIIHEKSGKQQEIITKFGNSALIFAAQSNSSYLNNYISTITLQNLQGATALHISVKNGHFQQILLKEARIQDNNGFSALHYAAQINNEMAICNLVDKEGDLVNMKGDTALVIACKYQQPYNLLLNQTMIKNNLGQFALLIAIQNKFPITALLEEKSLRGRLQETPLMVAAQCANKQAVNMLISEQKKLRDINGCAASMYALQNGHYTIFKQIFKEEADLSLCFRCSSICLELKCEQTILDLINRTRRKLEQQLLE
ncbi:Protein_21.1 [Hexamita inflata]|uniref:Protein 21.1 n=1 Tax=Hexamita inflata TaxID=28002 RepID=A0AA86Q749_9EUKA|nr:Protein 21.1 [Hexamita inflata]